MGTFGTESITGTKSTFGTNYTLGTKSKAGKRLKAAVFGMCFMALTPLIAIAQA